MMKTLILLLLLAPLPALALDGADAAKEGGAGVAVAAATATLLARRRFHARHASTVAAEATRWGWDEKRQVHELRSLKRRHGVRAKLRRRRR